MSKLAIPIVLVAVIAGNARADDGIDALDKAVVAIAPGPGRDKAPVRPPPWCGATRSHDDGWSYDLASALDAYRNGQGYENRLMHAAQLACSAPSSPVAQRATAEIEQLWINETGLAEADAVTSIAERVDADAFAADHDKLCAAIGEPPDEDRDPLRSTLTKAWRDAMGCYISSPLWMQKTNDLDALARYVDRGPVERDPIAHLAWVLQRQFDLLDQGATPEAPLVSYIADQFDLHAVDAAAVMQALDAAPFRGSRYARVLALESIARARMQTALVDDRVAVATADPMWKELLVTAPQRGAAAWQAAAARDHDAVARSDAFLDKLRAGDDVRGCATALRADVLAVLKTLPRSDLDTLGDAISAHPLAGLLLQRLYQCMNESHEVGAILPGLAAANARVMTGPRMAAYWAAEDALSALPRRKQPVLANRLPNLSGGDGTSYRNHTFVRIDEAVIARVDKVVDGVKVSFVEDKGQVMDQECHDGDKIARIYPDGRVEYKQVCHDTHMITVDRTPPARTVPASYADGLRPGRRAVIQAPGGDANLPVVVYADRTSKRVVVYYGFTLE